MRVRRFFRNLAHDYDLTWRAGAVVAGVALLVGGECVRDRRYAEHGPGDLGSARLVRAADGHAFLVVGERVDYQDLGRGGSSMDESRLELVDLADGTQKARARVDATMECVVASPGLLWCDAHLVSGSRLEVRDAATLAVHASHDALVAKAPPLATQADVRIDPQTREAWLAKGPSPAPSPTRAPVTAS